MELKCKVQGQNRHLLYQWFKDDVAVIGQNSASLVLDAVQLKDFGRYTCYASYPDCFGEGEKSSPATLDVIPQPVNGMSEYSSTFSLLISKTSVSDYSKIPIDLQLKIQHQPWGLNVTEEFSARLP